MKLALILILVLLLSCNKDESKRITTNATIAWTGSVAVDGCDWCVKTDSVNYYHPDLLDTAFQYDQLNVKITYELASDKFRCGFSGIPIIHIVDTTK